VRRLVRWVLAAPAALALAAAAGEVHAFTPAGCGSGECRDCHSLTREEARALLSGFVDNVTEVSMGPVPGLFLLEVTRGGQRGPVYMDFSKKYVIAGQVIHLPTKEDITGAKTAGPPVVDPSSIPLEGAVVMGNPLASARIVEFSDPDCHFCAKLHEALKTVLARRKDLAVYVKLYTRTGDEAVKAKARAVVCAGTEKALEDAYAGKALPPPSCGSFAPEETAKTAAALGIRGTPTLILPDGRMIRGYRDAETLLRLLEAGQAAPAAPGGTGKR